MEKDIDIELLISLVKERPVLWNKHLEQYKSRNLTLDAWRDVCSRLHDEYEYFRDEEQNNFGRHVVKKWTNVKDSWVKAQRKSKERNKFSKKASRKYIYQDKLSFLQENFGNKEMESINFKTESEDGDLIEHDLEPSSSQANTAERTRSAPSRPWNRPSRKWKSDDSVTVETHSNLESPEIEIGTSYALASPELRNDSTLEAPDFRINSTFEAAEDRHISFFKGILPSLHQLNEEETLQFQMGVLNVLHEIRTAKSVFVEPLNSSMCQ